MIGVPFAHIAGIPVEETIGSIGPAVVVAAGMTWARFRGHLRRLLSRRRDKH